MWYILAGLALLAGLVQGWSIIQRGRRPLVATGATYTWTEHPIPFWREDWVIVSFATLHNFSLLALALLCLLDSGRPATSFFVLLGRSFALGVVGWASGLVLAFPLVRYLAPPVTIQLFADGVTRGQYVVDWAGFSSFQADTATHTIRLYSAFTPQVVRAVWQPPSQELFGMMVERLAQVLPSQPPSVSTPWYRSRAALLAALLISILPLVAGGIVVYQLSLPWSWLYYSLAVPVVAGIGVALIQRFQIG